MQASPAISKLQSKTTVGHHIPPSRMAIPKVQEVRSIVEEAKLLYIVCEI